MFHLSHGAGEGAGTIGHSEDTVVSLIETKMPCIQQFPPKSLLFGLLTLLTFVSRVWGLVEWVGDHLDGSGTILLGFGDSEELKILICLSYFLTILFKIFVV